MICNADPTCKRPGGGCACLDFQLKCATERKANDWTAWAERHGYVHTGYLNGKPHLVKAQVRR